MSVTHPRLEDIYAYTARRLVCPPEWLEGGRIHAMPAREPDDANFLTGAAFRKPDVICLTELPEAAVLRTNPDPSPAVERLLEVLGQGDASRRASIENLAAEAGLAVVADLPDPYFYLHPERYRPFVSSGAVRSLDSSDAALLAGLHAAIPEGMRWFVEIDHPIVFGCFEGDRLVSVASHFLFDPERIAAAGVLTHPDHRRKGHGKAVVSAVVDWAIERGYTVEWSTWLGNEASLKLALALGFEVFATETEYVVVEQGEKVG